MSPQTCKIAFIGAGNMAREHIRAFADVPGVMLAGIHSRTRARAEELAAEYQVAGVYDSVAELYEQTRAELVVVTVFEIDRKSTRLNSSHIPLSRMPSSA